MHETNLDDPDAPRPRGRWDFLFSWTGLFLVGWVLYELTSQPMLGVTIFCCKLGWEDFRTGVWLRRKDPVAERGKMELWIFFASGLWRTAIAAFVIMMVVMIFAARLGVPAEAELAEAGWTAMIGFSVCTLATLRALWLSLWYQRKLWLHPSIHETRRDNVWPPIPRSPQPVEAPPVRQESARRRGRPRPPSDDSPQDLYARNKAGTLIVFSVTAISFLLSLFSVAAMAAIGVADETRIMVFILFFFFGYPLIILAMRDFQRRHLLASCPEECWGADAIVAVDEFSRA